MPTQTALKQRPQPTAILFDLDGTLLDTAPDLGAALNAVLRLENRPQVAAHEYTPIASHGSAGLLRYAFGSEFDLRREQLRQAFLTEYARNIATHTQLFEGVADLLVQLKQANIAVAIVTNKPHHLTAQLLPYYPELNAVKVVVSGDTLKVAKPNPEPLFHACEQLGVNPLHCWYVGDAERDIEAGRRAGMYTVLAKYGYISADEKPENWGADVEILTPLKLLDLW